MKNNMATTTIAGLKRKSPPDDVCTDVELSISFQDGNKLFFKVKHDLEFFDVFRDFCNRKKLEFETLKFIHEGTEVKGRQTPKMLNLENGAEIFAVRSQVGGGVSC
ncbi:small ubiquitin-related modifier 1 [Vigna radiata var. radiata]|uniref:Small ubiquitin-related modifier 1 n=1 Tax=Vigna radiata var. radiata TaxID=3916 RepID=A0A1S3TF31_VIGRR|nr:small ubiquitin-related modifier 1 [Vigna radiata var. radiata]